MIFIHHQVRFVQDAVFSTNNFFAANRGEEVDGGADFYAGESGFDHAYDFEGLFVQRNGLADDVGASSVFLLPEGMAEDGGSGAASFIVGG